MNNVDGVPALDPRNPEFGHTWLKWQRYLRVFAQELFQQAPVRDGEPQAATRTLARKIVSFLMKRYLYEPEIVL